jgi:hypothetical protein
MDGIAGAPSGNVCGHIGVDMGIGTTPYYPCYNPRDTFYGACADAYYHVESFTSFPYGVFIDNTDNGLAHYWGRKVTTAALEIYPHTSCAPGSNYDVFRNAYGGARVSVDTWNWFANGGVYSPHVGTVQLPCNLPGCSYSKLNGFISRNGAPAAAEVDMFGNANVTTSTGYPLSGFSAGPTNGDGYYTSTPLYPGTYETYVTDGSTAQYTDPGAHTFVAKIKKYGVGVYSTGDRLDVTLDQGKWHCFGIAPCTFFDDAVTLGTYDGTHFLLSSGTVVSGAGTLSDTSAGGAAVFTLVHVLGNNVGLRNKDGLYVQALYGGGNAVIMSSQLSSWETFTLVDVTPADMPAGSKIAFRTSDGAHYLTAAYGGGNGWAGNAIAISQWETFTRTYKETWEISGY